MAVTRTGVFSENSTTGVYEYGVGGTGRLTVNGGSVVTLTASDLLAEPTLRVGSGAAGDGGVIVTGANSRLTLQANSSENAGASGNVGRNGGTGVLTITAGGTFELLDPSTDPVDTSDFAESEFFNVGRDAGSVGRVAVSAGTFRISGNESNLSVGRDGGNGTVSLAAGSVFELESNSTGASSATLQVGRGTGSVGVVTFNASTGSISGDADGSGASVVFGRGGGTGTLNILNDSSVTISGDTFSGLNLGRDNGSRATLNLDSSSLALTGENVGMGIGTTGSTGTANLSNNAQLTFSGASAAVNVGLTGTGSLNVRSGSVVALTSGPAGNPFMTIGSNGGNGAVTVDGGALDLVSSGSFVGITVGTNFGGAPETAGQGSVVVQGGGTIDMAATGENPGGDLLIGGGQGSVGSVTVRTGGGIDLNGIGQIDVGTFAGGRGSLTVDGSTSIVEGVQTLSVGIDSGNGSNPAVGNGTATLLSGGKILAGTAIVGRGGTLSGTGTIQGDGAFVRGGKIDLTGNGLATLTFSSDLAFQTVAGSSVVMEVGSAGNDRVSVGDEVALGDGLVDLIINAVGSYKFVTGETRTLLEAGTVSGELRNVTVNGQHADFSYYIGGLAAQPGDVVLRALINGTSGGQAVLDFGSTSTLAASVTTDAAGEATVMGGVFGAQGGTAVNADEFRGTAAGDSFVIAATDARSYVLRGQGGNDTLKGGAGNDRLYGGTGINEMTGGLGSDTYFIDNAADKVFEAAGTAQGIRDGIVTSVSYVLAAGQAVEVMETDTPGATTAINLTGNEFNQEMFGNAGANLLNGGGGTDRMTGGGGNDRYVVDSAADLVFELAGGGTDQIISSVTYTLRAGVEVETLSTSGGTTTMNLVGNELAQRVIGNDGINTLYGNGGDDTMQGLGGADTLHGGIGNDRLYGGLGDDRFVFTTALNATTNLDTIYDFANVVGNDDRFLLENAIFTKLTATGALNAAFFKANVTGTATDVNDYIVYETDTGKLFYDADGNGAGAAVQFALLTNKAALTAGDFFVI